MTFREIDQAMLDLVDEETGEILDIEAFNKLAMKREDKAENMALWALDLKDEVDAIGKEIARLQTKKQQAERKLKSLKTYLPIVLAGERLRTDRVFVYYKNTEAVKITDENAFIDWVQNKANPDYEEELLKYSQPEISKSAVKAMLKDGKELPFAEIVKNKSTIIM